MYTLGTWRSQIGLYRELQRRFAVLTLALLRICLTAQFRRGPLTPKKLCPAPDLTFFGKYGIIMGFPHRCGRDSQMVVGNEIFEARQPASPRPASSWSRPGPAAQPRTSPDKEFEGFVEYLLGF